MRCAVCGYRIGPEHDHLMDLYRSDNRADWVHEPDPAIPASKVRELAVAVVEWMDAVERCDKDRVQVDNTDVGYTIAIANLFNAAGKANLRALLREGDEKGGGE